MLLVFFVVSGILLYEREDAPQVIVPPPVRTEEKPLEITGLTAAAERMPLRDPFTVRHESRRERLAPPPAGEGHEEPAPPPIPTDAAAMATKQKEPPVPLTLRGIVTGADGTRIAILARGQESAALSAGESWHGYRIAQISDGAVTLHASAGTMTLTRE